MYKIIIGCFFLMACSTQKEIGKSVSKLLFSDSAIGRAHVGISIYDPSANKYLYNHQPNKYFVPASNVKIFSAYVGLKYLGDSLPGIQYIETADTVHLFPTYLLRLYKTNEVSIHRERTAFRHVITVIIAPRPAIS